MARQESQKDTAKGQTRSANKDSSAKAGTSAQGKSGSKGQGKDPGQGSGKGQAGGRQIRPESPMAVQKALKGIHYPASKADLLKQAQQNNAPDIVLSRIRALPGDRFEKPTDVRKALGKKE